MRTFTHEHQAQIMHVNIAISSINTTLIRVCFHTQTPQKHISRKPNRNPNSTGRPKDEHLRTLSRLHEYEVVSYAFVHNYTTNSCTQQINTVQKSLLYNTQTSWWSRPNGSLKISWFNTPPKKLRLPSSTRPPCRYLPSAQ